MYGHTNPTIRTTADGEQVGPKMHAAVKEAADEVFPSKKQLAERVAPRGGPNNTVGLKYGYRTVERCIAKGLLCRPDPSHEAANPHGRGAVYITEKGERYLENHTDD